MLARFLTGRHRERVGLLEGRHRHPVQARRATKFDKYLDEDAIKA